jgi:hypothetical protein
MFYGVCFLRTGDCMFYGVCFFKDWRLYVNEKEFVEVLQEVERK